MDSSTRLRKGGGSTSLCPWATRAMSVTSFNPIHGRQPKRVMLGVRVCMAVVCVRGGCTRVEQRKRIRALYRPAAVLQAQDWSQKPFRDPCIPPRQVLAMGTSLPHAQNRPAMPPVSLPFCLVGDVKRPPGTKECLDFICLFRFRHLAAGRRA